jgi:hypothetical protein
MAQSSVRVVDFIPQYDILGDIKKVSESDYTIQNIKVVAIAIILCTEAGSNVLLPEMGLRQVLKSLLYQDATDIYQILDSMNSHLYKYSGYQTRAYINEDDPDTNISQGEVAVRIDIEGVMEPLEVNINKANTIIVKHPSVFTGK